MATNLVPVIHTDIDQEPVTNMVVKPEAELTFQAAGSIVNAFLPGIGSIVVLVPGGGNLSYRI